MSLLPLTEIMIGFESDHVVLSELDGAVEVCIKYFNAASAKTAEEASTGVSRYDIKVDYESINGSAGMFDVVCRQIQ